MASGWLRGLFACMFCREEPLIYEACRGGVMKKILNVIWSRATSLIIEIKTSFWFVPTLIVMGAMATAFGLILLDATGVNPDVPLLFGAGAEGARGMLEAIAGSMITVAGVVFSITIVVLSLASNQYTSRVLRNFIRDRGNQVVLGVFLGIFAYCLIVLRVLRGGEEAFVPSLAVFGAVLMALAGIGFFIYFIHHTASSVQSTFLLARVSEETLEVIERLFPDELRKEEAWETESAFGEGEPWVPVPSRTSGYVQNIAIPGLLRFAKEHNLLLRLNCVSGDFVVEGTPLLFAARGEVGNETARELNLFFSLNNFRTIDQDCAFGIRQMVDIALKALSPGVNDTSTAVEAADHLTVVMSKLITRRIWKPFHTLDGAVRLLTKGPTFEWLLQQAFDPIRQFGGGNLTILMRLLHNLRVIGSLTTDPERRRLLAALVQAIEETASIDVKVPRDLEAARTEAAEVISFLNSSSEEKPGAAAETMNGKQRRRA